MTEWYPTTGSIPLPPRGRVAVVGGGNWGTTFAKIIADGGNDVTLAVRRPELADEINEAHRNTAYLPGVNLPERILATAAVDEAVSAAELIFLSVLMCPSKKFVMLAHLSFKRLIDWTVSMFVNTLTIRYQF